MRNISIRNYFSLSGRRHLLAKVDDSSRHFLGENAWEMAHTWIQTKVTREEYQEWIDDDIPF